MVLKTIITMIKNAITQQIETHFESCLLALSARKTALLDEVETLLGQRIYSFLILHLIVSQREEKN